MLRVHETDIRRLNPDFVYDPCARDLSFLVLKGDETVGVVILCAVESDTAQLLLDWGTPRYRDHSPGELVFGAAAPFRRRRGLRRVLAPIGMGERYHERLGFRREGDAYVL